MRGLDRENKTAYQINENLGAADVKDIINCWRHTSHSGQPSLHASWEANLDVRMLGDCLEWDLDDNKSFSFEVEGEG